MSTSALEHKSVDSRVEDSEKGRTAEGSLVAFGDEGAKVLATFHSDHPITPEESKEVLRKVDMRLMPLLFVVFGLQYCDKTALGTAALFGLITDLGLFTVVSEHPPVISTKRYSNAAMIFFVGYVVGGLPLGYIAQKYPKGRVCGMYVLLWGIVCILAPACTSYPGIMVQRLMLGILESGVNPAFLSIIGQWYTKREQGLRGPIMGSASGFFTPLYLIFTWGVVTIGNPLHAWRVIYYFIGGATILLSFVVFAILPDTAASASWLTERQRYVAVERLHSNQAGTSSKRFKPKQMLEAATDIKVWLLMIITFCVAAPGGAAGSFASLVIKNDYGATGRRTLLLLMPSGAVGGISSLLAGYLSLYIRNGRCAILVLFALISMTGFLIDWKAPLNDKQALLAGIYLLTAYAGSFSQIIGLAISNTAGATKRSTVSAGIFIITSLSGIASPYYFATGAPRYQLGFKITAVLVCISIGLTGVYAALCYYENKRRDELPPMNHDEAFEDQTDKHNKAFRYVL